MDILNNLEIGMRIRKQRENLGIPREKLAERLDISAKFISDIELGIRGMSIATLAKLSLELKMTTDYILFGDKEKTDISPIITAFSFFPTDKIDYAEQLLALFLKALK